MLTAKHCFYTGLDCKETDNCEGTPALLPTALTVDVVQDNNGTAGPGFVAGAIDWTGLPGDDMLMMRLSQNFSVNGSTLGHSIQAWNGSPFTPMDQPHSIGGFGRRTVTAGSCSVTGALRTMQDAPDEVTYQLQSGGDLLGYYAFDQESTATGTGYDAPQAGDSGAGFLLNIPGAAYQDFPLTAVQINAWQNNGTPTCTITSVGASRFALTGDIKAIWFHDEPGAWTGPAFDTFDTNTSGLYTFTEPPMNEGGAPNWFFPFLGSAMAENSNAHSYPGEGADCDRISEICPRPGTRAILDSAAMANGVVSATIWANDDDAAGVFFAYRDECNYIRFSVAESLNRGLNPHARLIRNRNCVAEELDYTNLTDAFPGFDWTTIHLLELEVREGNMWGWLDEQLVVVHFDDQLFLGEDEMPLDVGKAGLYAWAMDEVWFLDFAVEPNLSFH